MSGDAEEQASERMMVSPGLIADRDAICRLASQTFLDSYGSTNSPSDLATYLAASFGHEQVGQELVTPGMWFYLVHRANHKVPVGYAKMRAGEPPACVVGESTIEIQRIYVAADSIGKGVGRLLMECCLEKARNLKRGVVWLGVDRGNLRAIEFYKKWEFEIVGEQEFMLGSDRQMDLVMQLNLP